MLPCSQCAHRHPAPLPPLRALTGLDAFSYRPAVEVRRGLCNELPHLGYHLRYVLSNRACLQASFLQRLADDITQALARNERLLVVAASTFIMSTSHTALRPVMPLFVKVCPVCQTYCLIALHGLHGLDAAWDTERLISTMSMHPAVAIDVELSKSATWQQAVP